MTPPFFLSDDEIYSLTRKKKRGAQVRTLAQMGIRHTIRPDGSPVVIRQDLSDNPISVKTPEPNWKAANATRP